MGLMGQKNTNCFHVCNMIFLNVDRYVFDALFLDKGVHFSGSEFANMVSSVTFFIRLYIFKKLTVFVLRT